MWIKIIGVILVVGVLVFLFAGNFGGPFPKSEYSGDGVPANPCTGFPDEASRNVPLSEFFQFTPREQGQRFMAAMLLDLDHQSSQDGVELWEGGGHHLRVGEILTWTHPTDWGKTEADLESLFAALELPPLQRSEHVTDSASFYKQQWHQSSPVYAVAADVLIHKTRFAQAGYHSSLSLMPVHEDTNPVATLTFDEAVVVAQNVQECRGTGHMLKSSSGEPNQVAHQSLAYAIQFFRADPTHHCSGDGFFMHIDAVTGGYLGVEPFMCD